RRSLGFDWCIIRLGLPGIIRGVVVDTSHFKGNYPEQCSLEGCAIDGLPTTEQLVNESVQWTEILPNSSLAGDSHNQFGISSDERWTLWCFRFFPAGGVPRWRVYGGGPRKWIVLRQIGGAMNLAAIKTGAMVFPCSVAF